MKTKWNKTYISLKEANLGDLVVRLQPNNKKPSDSICEKTYLMVISKASRGYGGITTMLFDDRTKEISPCYDGEMKFWKVEESFDTPLDLKMRKQNEKDL